MDSFRYDDADAALAESSRQGGAGAVLPDRQGFRVNLSPPFLRQRYFDPDGPGRRWLAHCGDAHRLFYRCSADPPNLENTNDVRCGRFYGFTGFRLAGP